MPAGTIEGRAIRERFRPGRYPGVGKRLYETG